MTTEQKRELTRIGIATVLFVFVIILRETGLLQLWFGNPGALWAEFLLFLVPYLIVGGEVLCCAFKNILHGKIFDEMFLMSIASLGAFALVFFPEGDPHMSEGVAVMLFWQIGEFCQDYAVERSRASIAKMMDIAPAHAHVIRDGAVLLVSPEDVHVGEEIMVKPGECVPLDGTVLTGSSALDTTALTGESMPREVEPGSRVISGCLNKSGALTVRVESEYTNSTVARILELVQSAHDRKAHAENFVTRFARWYTPIVVTIAFVIACIPPLLLSGAWADWIMRGLIFLVVSCPCALVISVPLSFFGGIGGASRLGIMIKGGNYLEALAKTSAVVFDKTGTLTKGVFQVSEVCPAEGVTADELLNVAAAAEIFSNHPVALALRDASPCELDQSRVDEVQEEAGGLNVRVDGNHVLVGNRALLERYGVEVPEQADQKGKTSVLVACEGVYKGSVLLADALREGSVQAIKELHDLGVERTVMLSGDHMAVAQRVASAVGIDEVHAELLPHEKVKITEDLLTRYGMSAGQRAHKSSNADDSTTFVPRRSLVYVGDGINDAPVLMRADVGIAMGAMGSDAAIEAADVVLMDDDPRGVARAIRLARRTMRIAWQNIIFALGVKFAVLVLAVFGLANLWLAVFADVGVALIAVMNAMRSMDTRRIR